METFLDIDQAKQYLETLWGGQHNEAITPFERVSAALNHIEPDRVPFDYAAVPELTRSLTRVFSLKDSEGLLQLFGCDCRRLVPTYTGEREELSDGRFYDIWGALRKRIGNESSVYEEIAGHPLKEASSRGEVMEYHRWPKPELWDWEALSRQISSLEERTQYYYRVHIGGIFETSWALYGLDTFLMDLYLNPEVPDALMDCCTDILIGCVHMIRDLLGDSISMIATYDDVATQQGLLMSPDMWREHILPRHRRLNHEIKRCGYKLFYHSCGAVMPLVEDFIREMKIDVLDPLQPRAEGMDFQKLKQQWGKQVNFHGGVDLQHTMPFATQEEVSREVSQLCRTLGNGGGYICSGAHHLQADTPWQNAAALFSTPRTVR